MGVVVVSVACTPHMTSFKVIHRMGAQMAVADFLSWPVGGLTELPKVWLSNFSLMVGLCGGRGHGLVPGCK